MVILPHPTPCLALKLEEKYRTADAGTPNCQGVTRDTCVLHQDDGAVLVVHILHRNTTNTVSRATGKKYLDTRTRKIYMATVLE